MTSRLKELKALVKSSFTNTWSGPIDPIKRRVACTAPSQPPGTATPNCTGAKKDESFDTACVLAHLAANLLHTYPIAIGLRPPVTLLRAIKLPPKRVGLTDGGHSPLSSKFVKSVSASARLFA